MDVHDEPDSRFLDTANNYPILDVSKISQLEDNLGALNLTLTETEIERLDNAAFNGKTYKNPKQVELI